MYHAKNISDGNMEECLRTSDFQRFSVKDIMATGETECVSFVFLCIGHERLPRCYFSY